MRGAVGGLDLDLDAVAELRRATTTRAENSTLACGKGLQPLDRHGGELVLLALHGERVGRLVLEHAEIELGHDLIAGRRSQMRNSGSTSPRAMTSSTMPRSASISSVAAWVVAARGMSLTLAVGLEHVNRQALAGERQRGDDADRAAAGNQNAGDLALRHLD